MFRLVLLAIAIATSWASAQNSEAPKITETAISISAPGAGPLRKIRHAPPVGAVYTAKLSMNTSVGREINGERRDPLHSPEVVLTLRITVDDIRDNGGVDYLVEITDVLVTTRTGTTPALLEQSRAYFEDKKGTKVHMVIGVRGQRYVGSENLPDVEDKQEDDVAWFVNRQIEAFNRAVSFIVVRVPAEECGPGAKWKIVEPCNVEKGQYLRESEVSWPAADKGDPHLSATISADWKSQTPIEPDSGKRTVANQALKLAGSLRAVLLPACPFPAEAEFKSVYNWKVLSRNREGNLLPGNFVDTFNLRITTKPEPAKPKGAR